MYVFRTVIRMSLLFSSQFTYTQSLSHYIVISFNDAKFISHLVQKNATVGVFELHFQFKGCSIFRLDLNRLEITEMLDELNKQNQTVCLQSRALSHENAKVVVWGSFCQSGSSFFTCACSSSLSFFISTSFFSMWRKSVMWYSAQMCS